MACAEHGEEKSEARISSRQQSISVGHQQRQRQRQRASGSKRASQKREQLQLQRAAARTGRGCTGGWVDKQTSRQADRQTNTAGYRRLDAAAVQPRYGRALALALASKQRAG